MIKKISIPFMAKELKSIVPLMIYAETVSGAHLSITSKARRPISSLFLWCVPTRVETLVF
jgi:fructose-specific phosphotransferase system IIC component